MTYSAAFATDSAKQSDLRIPVTIVTGFLGAGKTTLLRMILQQADLRGTLVLVNEFGEIGLDHLLVAELDATTVLLANGCVCCSVRDDVVRALRDAFGREPPRRVLIETSGLADPVPLIETLVADFKTASRYRPAAVITVVDAVYGGGWIEGEPVALSQIACADQILVSKADLADPAPLVAQLASLNPLATILVSDHGVVDSLDLDATATQTNDQIAAAVHRLAATGKIASRHAEHGIAAICLSIDEALSWEDVSAWMGFLLAARGESILRLKAILHLRGYNAPVAMHGIRHMLHPPELLPRWPDGCERRSRIVVIARGLDAQLLHASLLACIAAGETAA